MPATGSGAASGAVLTGGYPTAEDLEAYLRSLGILNEATADDQIAAMDLAAKAAAIPPEWERRTGWRPFLATGTPSLRRFNPPGPTRVLDFDAGALSVASLFVGVSINSAGEEWTAGEHWFFALPPYGWPYTAALLRYSCSRWPNSVEVTADWGFTATMPADVFQACLQYGAYLCLPQLSLPLSGGVESLRVLSSEVKYGVGGALSAQAKGWEAAWECAIRGYLRTVL